MFFFEILSAFGENRKRGKLEKSRHFGFLHRSVGNPRRDIALRRSVGCLAAVMPRGQNGTPRVRHDVEVLRRSVATVHSEQISYFCFRTPRIRTPIV